jgi:UDP-glucose 4-epimerase
MSEEVVLVTGVAGHWGSKVAARLLAETGYHVIGLDAKPPERKVRGLDFVQADVRNPVLADFLHSEGVDAVCHLAFVETRRPSESAFDLNVIGTTNFLGACAEAGVQKVVLKSSTAVYGARPGNSAFLAEDHSLRGSIRWGYVRDLLEVEAYCRGFRHQRPEMMITILRFPGIVGPTADTPMTRFLKERWALSLLGFDPMLQLIHEDDAVEALVHAVLNDVPGVFNVAAEDTLPLNKVRGLAGKPALSVFHPLAYRGGKLLGRVGLRTDRYLPIELDYLRYPWVGDLTRMLEELGFVPRHTAEEALREFAAWQRAGRYPPWSAIAARDEERLRHAIEQRQRARARRAASAAGTEEGDDDE